MHACDKTAKAIDRTCGWIGAMFVVLMLVLCSVEDNETALIKEPLATERMSKNR